MTELSGAVITLEDCLGTDTASTFPAAGLRKKPVHAGMELCNGGKRMPDFQRDDVDPSSAFEATPAANGSSFPD